jgi:hypothetical protein
MGQTACLLMLALAHAEATALMSKEREIRCYDYVKHPDILTSKHLYRGGGHRRESVDCRSRLRLDGEGASAEAIKNIPAT